MAFDLLWNYTLKRERHIQAFSSWSELGVRFGRPVWRRFRFILSLVRLRCWRLDVITSASQKALEFHRWANLVGIMSCDLLRNYTLKRESVRFGRAVWRRFRFMLSLVRLMC